MVYSDEIEDKIDQIMPELKRRYPGFDELPLARAEAAGG